jgi:plasmid stabilization system protein ParE
MKVSISQSAYKDLSNAYNFYESQQDGLGEYFQDSLFSDIDSLKYTAGIHPKYLSKYRLLSRRFPYAVYYVINDNAAVVIAVLDCRRNPEWIENKLK